MNGRTRDAVLPASIHLGRIAGVPLGLHFSWFIIALLITMSLAFRFRLTQPQWDPALVWGVSAVTAVLFFITLLAHELSHALVARARGIPVRSITLFALGGIANIEKEANTARTEFLIAIVGPVVSFAIGVGAIVAARALGWSMADGTSGVMANMLGWLGSINIVLAIFNLIPGYPLDGGRVLRAVLWGMHKDGERATRQAANAGQVVAWLFIAFGVLQFFLGADFGGLWLAFIGWFLLTAAQAAYTEVSIVRLLRGVRVGDIMATECAVVEPRRSVQSLVEDLMLRTGRRCVMVQSNGRVLGLVTPRDVRDVDRSRWVELTAEDVMRPLETLKTVTPETAASEAFTIMAREDVNQLPVMSDGRLAGMVSRGQILQVLRARSELAQSNA